MKNIVVVGGSYVGCKLIDFLAPLVHETHTVVLVEKNSHFQHLFAFPRVAVVPDLEQRAFIPYKDAFHACPPGSTRIVRGTVTEIQQDQVIIDNGRESIPYEFLALATGTVLPAPGTIPCDDKKLGRAWFQSFQTRIQKAQSIIAVGGGAVGVQMVTDIADHFGKDAKDITLIHSRPNLMNRFDSKLHDVVMRRLEELGVNTILSNRVKSWGESELILQDGRRLNADLVIPCTGSSPRSDLLRAFAPNAIDIKSGEVNVEPTMQISAWTETFEPDLDSDESSPLSSPPSPSTSLSTSNDDEGCCKGPDNDGVCCRGPVRQRDGASDWLRSHGLVRLDEMDKMSEAKDILTPAPESSPPTPPRRVNSARQPVWRVDGEALVSAVNSLALRTRTGIRSSPLSLTTRTRDEMTKTLNRRLTYPNIFALGDVARVPVPGGAHKAARPGAEQAGIVARNVARMIKAETCREGSKGALVLEHYKDKPAGIRLSLGLKHKVLFRNPIETGGVPMECEEGENGTIDVSCGMIWRLRAPGVTDQSL